MATETIEDQTTGFITSFGKVRLLDTSGLTEGDDVYLSPNTPGGYTTTRPVAPDRSIYLGVVVRTSPTNGIIFMRPGNSEALSELSDTIISDVQNGDIIQWNTANSRFMNTDGLSTFAAASHGSQHSPDASDPLLLGTPVSISTNSS